MFGVDKYDTLTKCYILLLYFQLVILFHGNARFIWTLSKCLGVGKLYEGDITAIVFYCLYGLDWLLLAVMLTFGMVTKREIAEGDGERKGKCPIIVVSKYFTHLNYCFNLFANRLETTTFSKQLIIYLKNIYRVDKKTTFSSRIMPLAGIILGPMVLIAFTICHISRSKGQLQGQI